DEEDEPVGEADKHDVSQLQSPQQTTHNRPGVAEHGRKPHPCPRYPASPMVPPFVMTTKQWVTDPVEEFNLPGDRSPWPCQHRSPSRLASQRPGRRRRSHMTRQLGPGKWTYRTRVSCGLGGRPDELLRGARVRLKPSLAGRATPYCP